MVALLIAGAGISLLTILAHLLDLYVTPFQEDQELADNPLGAMAILLTGVLGLATIAVYIATAIAFLMWLYRANNNIAAFGEPREHSAGWAVGSFFVPFANLVVPYRATREIWRKSDPVTAEGMFYAVSPPGFFPAWWGFWIASNIASNVYVRMTLAEAPLDASAIVGIFSEVLSVGAAWLAILVVRDIDRRQEARAAMQSRYSGPVPPPPPVFQPAPTTVTTETRVATSALGEASTTGGDPQPNSATTGA